MVVPSFHRKYCRYYSEGLTISTTNTGQSSVQQLCFLHIWQVQHAQFTPAPFCQVHCMNRQKLILQEDLGDFICCWLQSEIHFLVCNYSVTCLPSYFTITFPENQPQFLLSPLLIKSSYYYKEKTYTESDCYIWLDNYKIEDDIIVRIIIIIMSIVRQHSLEFAFSPCVCMVSLRVLWASSLSPKCVRRILNSECLFVILLGPAIN